ncbi:MAG: DUF3365 domain-containing protein [Desulfuromonas sp.]|nr:DUF3365 domain-containing protein [Desulfuromonas sp.]
MIASMHVKLTVKLTLILSCILILVFLLTSFLTYRDQQKMAQKIALDQGRNVSRELIAIFNHISDVVRNEPENNYALVPQVMSTQIAKKISTEDHYSIRQVALAFRNPDNRPDDYEVEQLKIFATSKKNEIYSVTKKQGKEVFRYMQALVADDSCLKCHGKFESAPTFIQQRFPKDHPSYNYKLGDILGAVSVVRPMTDLYGAVAKNLQQALYFRAGILLLVVIVTWFFVRHFIIVPIKAASKTVHQITRTGDLHERIPVTRVRDEIGQLLLDFNVMMAELERTTLQRQESENRYRSLIEVSHSAIVTFLENGKIVISNQQAEQLIGLSRSALLGESIFDYIEDSARLKSKIAQLALMEEHETIEEPSSYMFMAASGAKQKITITLVLASAVEQLPMFTAILRLPDSRG